MKQFVLLAFLTFASILSASAQSDSNTDSWYQWGVKGGLDGNKISHLSPYASSNFTRDKGYGFVAGFWGRIGNPYVFFQPEVYLTSRNTIMHDTTSMVTNGNYLGLKTESNNATFTSVDIPLLIGTKFGSRGTGFHLNTGPAISLTIADRQSTANSADDFAHLKYKSVNYGWQFGAGVDLWRFTLDARYEMALSKFDNYNGDHFKLNTLSLALGFNFGKQ